MYRRTKDCTAMILYNDEVAGSYMDFLKDRGLRVPEDISLVSFDDAGPGAGGRSHDPVRDSSQVQSWAADSA